MSEITQLIVVEQLPVIRQTLENIAVGVRDRVKLARELAKTCTEENKQEIKTIRADLNKEYADLESRRKAVKNAVLAPYNEFEKEYDRLVGSLYGGINTELGAVLIEVEKRQKAKLEIPAREYFNEYCASLGLSDIPFEKAVLAVKLSDNPTGLKKKIKEFLDGVKKDIDAIMTQPHADEIMVEYRKHYQFGVAMTDVFDRHKAAEREKERIAEIQRKTQHDLELIQTVDAVVEKLAEVYAPVVAEEEIPAEFTVTATITKLRALREYMEKEGIQYK